MDAFNVSKTWIGNCAFTSTAVTCVWQKKKNPVIEVDSDNENINLPAAKDRPLKSVYTISSGSESPLPPPEKLQITTAETKTNNNAPVATKSQPPLPSKKLQTKRQTVIVETEFNYDESTTAKKSQPPLPSSRKLQPKSNKLVMVNKSQPLLPPSIKPWPFKEHGAVVASEPENNRSTSDSNKQSQLSLPNASKNPVGSGDNYVQEQDEESESETTQSPQTCHTHLKSKEKNVKGREKPVTKPAISKTTTTCYTVELTVVTANSVSSSKLLHPRLLAN
ncbi:hypothetical protein C0995_012922 [Termitomyces sp. Mi166|nr:hypothetical protein C0995_012922 [Termitomyces sp. Mi166\